MRAAPRLIGYRLGEPMSASHPPEYQQSPPQPPHRSWPRRHKILTALGSGFGLALMLTACGGSGSTAPAMITAHGTFNIDFASGGNCQYAGEQVVITDAAGKVLVTPTLPASATETSITVGGVKVPVESYPWSATVPVEARYGVTVGSTPPYYATEAQMTKGIDLSC